jgi:hypothetical protein
LGANWSGYPFAEPVVRTCQQIADVHLEPGQSYRFINVLHGQSEREPRPVSLSPVAGAPGAVLLEEGPTQRGLKIGNLVFRLRAHRNPTRRVVGIGAFNFGGLSLDAAAYVIGPGDHLTLFGARHATMNGKPIPLDKSGNTSLLDGGWLVGSLVSRLVANQPTSQPANLRQPTSQPANQPTSQLRQLWSSRDRLSSYLLTANRGTFEALATGFTVIAAPKPLPENVFGKPGEANDLTGLTDGDLLTTDGGVQWGDDQAVTLTFDLQAEYDLHRVAWKEWWANQSSKGKTFQLDTAVLEVSNDHFVTDVRRVAELRDTAEHGNWGAPGHAPVDYQFDLRDHETTDHETTDHTTTERGNSTSQPANQPTSQPANVRARYLRLTLTPRSGTGIYLAELEIWGYREGLELGSPPPAPPLQGGEKRTRPILTPVHTFTSLAAADLDGDGRQEVVAGATNGKVYVLDDNGVIQWTFATGGMVHSVAAGDLDGDGAVEVIAGSQDTKVYALDAQGQERWQFAVPYYKRTPIVRTVFLADLDGDGRQEVIAGADSWRYYALNAEGRELWHFESVHGSTAGTAGDLDGDGTTEVICGTEYYWWPCVNANGSQRWAYSTRTGPRANSVAVGDLIGDGRQEVVFGGADTTVQVVDADGKALWQYNTGDEVQKVVTADVDADGKAEVIVGSMSFNVYVLKGDGTRQWRRDLGDVVTEVAVADLTGDAAPEIIVGADADAGGTPPLAKGGQGGVWVFDAAGQPLAAFSTGGPILALCPADLTGDGRPELVVSAADGNVYGLEARSVTTEKEAGT